MATLSSSHGCNQVAVPHCTFSMQLRKTDNQLWGSWGMFFRRYWFSELVYGCTGWFSLTGMGLNRGHLLRGLCFWASETLLGNASDMMPGEDTGLEASPFPLGILIMKSPSDGLWTLWHVSSRNDAEGSAGCLPGILGCLCSLIRHLLSSGFGR